MFLLDRDELKAHMENFINQQWLTTTINADHMQVFLGNYYMDDNSNQFIEMFKPIMMMMEKYTREQFENNYQTMMKDTIRELIDHMYTQNDFEDDLGLTP